MVDDVDIWKQDKGIDFLKRVGVGENNHVLDFGAGYGHYSIPAARVVGEDGIIYAVEKDKKALIALRQEKEHMGLSQLKLIDSNEKVHIDIDDGKFDICMLYDIMHYFEKEKRIKLYKEIKRLLRKNGILSIYPKHTGADFAMDNFKDMSKEDVIREVEGCSFDFEEKICGDLIHDESIISGCVFNLKNI